MSARVLVPYFAVIAASFFFNDASAQYSNRNTDNNRYSPRYPQTIGVVYGSSDSCDVGKVAAIIKSDTNCDTLSDSEKSWSIKTKNVCHNISDTNVRSACRGIQAEVASTVIYGSSDSCDITKVEAIVDETTDCETLGTERAWSIKVNGVCKNISDTDVRTACRGISAEAARNVIYGMSDNCDATKVLTIVDRRTNCDLLPDAKAWSIKQNGVCKNISDTDAKSACRALKYQNAPNIVYGMTDSCEETKIILAVGPRTDCSHLPNGGERSWSVKINGACNNISDTTVAQACLGIQSEIQ